MHTWQTRKGEKERGKNKEIMDEQKLAVWRWWESLKLLTRRKSINDKFYVGVCSNPPGKI